MLILTRRESETICIGDDVSIEILRINGKQIRLGISAPRHIEVHREEIYRKVRRERDCYPEED